MTTWQETYETGQISDIAFGAVEAAFSPPFPTTGSNYDWSSDADWTGIQSEGGPVMAEDDLAFEFAAPAGQDVRPPGIAQRRGIVWDQVPGVLRAVDIVSYEIMKKIMALCSNWDVSGAPILALTDTITPKACCIQFHYVGVFYMPNVEIYHTGMTAGRVPTAKSTLRLEISGTSTVPGGYYPIHWDDA